MPRNCELAPGDDWSRAQEMNMTGFTQNEPPNVGKDVQVKGSLTSEDGGFYAIIISAIIFLIAALSGHLA
ncbi:MAG: hypothetical protein M0Q47_11455 [Methanothrix sp.]|nr:hypothetical protein [Methanothrix sp.]